jgi:hypothetical protein
MDFKAWTIIGRIGVQALKLKRQEMTNVMLVVSLHSTYLVIPQQLLH